MQRAYPEHPQQSPSIPNPYPASPDLKRRDLQASVDCLSCRLTGAAALTGVGLYVLYYGQDKSASRAYRTGSRVLGGVFLVTAVARLFSLPPFPRAQKKLD